MRAKNRVRAKRDNLVRELLNLRNNSHFQVETKVKEKHLQLRGKYSKREIKQGIANYHTSKECAQSERERQEEDSRNIIL